MRTLTDKGQALHEEKVKRFQACFKLNYDKWKTTAKQAKGALDDESLSASVHEHIGKI